jgi:hypothetical protein
MSKMKSFEEHHKKGRLGEEPKDGGLNKKHTHYLAKSAAEPHEFHKHEHHGKKGKK